MSNATTLSPVQKELRRADKCLGCGWRPIIVHLPGDLYYCRCPNPKCTKWGAFDFIGMRPANAVDEWNFMNRASKSGRTKG